MPNTSNCKEPTNETFDDCTKEVLADLHAAEDNGESEEEC